MSMRHVLRTNTRDTRPEPYEPDGLVAAEPGPATISRRGALALVGGGAVFMAVITAGQTLGGWTRQTALLLPRGRTHGDGPNDFQINRTAAAARITPDLTGERWRLTLTGGPSPDLAKLAGVPEPRSAFVRSVERFGAFNRATLQANQVMHPDSLLALRVNDADLSLDHGFPARIIVPALPGVHNTKWVASIDFRAK